MTYKSVAFIPARSGSKRVPNKNIKEMNGHPLLAYAIITAIESGMFDSVVCVTDSEEYSQIAKYYGAEVPALRPSNISGEKSPDIEWVLWILDVMKSNGREFDIFSILRPTSPFRSKDAIIDAYKLFLNNTNVDSLRAIRKCKEHPGKMWVKRNNVITPILPFENVGVPWHSCQYSSLPEIYVQDASLEIAWVRVALTKGSIAGDIVLPFLSRGLEGFDINEPEDWILAEYYIRTGEISLPIININPFKL